MMGFTGFYLVMMGSTRFYWAMIVNDGFLLGYDGFY